MPNERASAVLTSDFHLMETAPSTRTDDYLAAQENKLRFLQTLSDEHGHCPILCAGDIFHRWRASPWLCSWAYMHLPTPMIAVPGNHDLPMHSLAQYNKSALALLETVSPYLHVLKGDCITSNGLWVMGLPNGQLASLLRDDDFSTPDLPGVTKVLIVHELIWPKAGHALGGYEPNDLLIPLHPHFDLIISGDNHEHFTATYGDTLLVNPGSMMRLTIDQEQYQPVCYLYYADRHAIQEVPFPIASRVHVRHVSALSTQETMERFLQDLQHQWDLGLSFRTNLQTYFAQHHTPRSVQEVIWQHFEQIQTPR